MEKGKMNWRRLKDNLCPKCSASIDSHPEMALFKCSNLVCDFKISNERFEEIVGGMYKKGLTIPMYRNGEEVEDLRKRDWPECNFCHGVHHPDKMCEGFA